ncbi:MAG TPA: shikimate dehydrogenase [Bacteroidales bacterium]|nr:shikimate dehydrogenase [Bacteroidales bacterium]HPE42825.1 shikimate dehydrogenase [Bacteroidales bacterium]
MKLYGLIGKKLSHSFSKEYFNKKFSENRVDAAYELFELENIEQLPELISAHTNLAGLNVTIPYKQQAVAYCSKLDKTAQMTGAVNTLVINRKNHKIELIGYNTDVIGFDSLIKPIQKQINNSKALILGTGGASKAVQYSLRSAGIGFTIVSRKASKPNQINYAMITASFIRNHQLIINTTPLGMYPDIESRPPIPYQYLNEKHILIDVIYNPAETAFLKAGKSYDAITLNGMPMLIAQADASWKIWSGNN